jgi:glycosyltransferase involved in cell wall biosynthesis
MRLALVISSLTCGGAERVLTLLANAWTRRGWEVAIVTIGPRREDFYTLAEGIRRVALDLAAPPRWPLDSLLNSLRRVRALRRALRDLKPDVVVSFMDKPNVLTLLACRGLEAPVVVSERVDPGHYSAGRAWAALRRWMYPAAAAVVVQTERQQEWFRRFIPRARVHLIPNPIGAPGAFSGPVPRLPEAEHLVVGMGRLTHQKGFDILIHAFARCAPRHPGWALVLLGEGEERGALEDLCARLQMAERISLPGVIPDPSAVLRRAALFVLPSRFEGFPNALLEAMACGVSAIAADCPSGPREIVEAGVNGLLVPPEDVSALAAAMERLMSSPEERRRIGGRAGRVVERFSLQSALEKWQSIFEALARSGRPAPAPAAGLARGGGARP